MWLSKIDQAYLRHEPGRYCQGDILRDFSFVEGANYQDGKIIVKDRHLPYSVILTQDCDLEQDYDNRVTDDSDNEDKYLRSVLLCPAYAAEKLRLGIHLEDEKLRMEKYNSARWSIIKHNNNYRYHFLEGFADYQVPELVIDFKHYITVSRDDLYNTKLNEKYLASLSELYRENLSLRFAQYLSRIGLPNLFLAVN